MPSLFAAALLLAASFSVTLEPPFVRAEARATDVGPAGLVLEVEVEIDTQALVVLVRGVGPVDELPPVALAELSPGRWGGIVELPIVVDILLGFEIIEPGGGAAVVSDLHRLSELGVDPAVFGVVETTTIAPGTGEPVDGDAGDPGPVGDTGPSAAPIWLAVAAGAAALALLLVWSRGGRDEDAAIADADVDGDVAADPADTR